MRRDEGKKGSFQHLCSLIFFAFSSLLLKYGVIFSSEMNLTSLWNEVGLFESHVLCLEVLMASLMLFFQLLQNGFDCRSHHVCELKSWPRTIKFPKNSTEHETQNIPEFSFVLCDTNTFPQIFFHCGFSFFSLFFFCRKIWKWEWDCQRKILRKEDSKYFLKKWTTFL